VKPGQPNWHEASLETAVALAAAIPTIWLSRRRIRRVVFLEGFLHVCAWCHKINIDGQWMPIERYFKTELKTNTSHGICQKCSEKFLPRGEKVAAVI
jgi:hypothetical protein